MKSLKLVPTTIISAAVLSMNLYSYGPDMKKRPDFPPSFDNQEINLGSNKRLALPPKGHLGKKGKKGDQNKDKPLPEPNVTESNTTTEQSFLTYNIVDTAQERCYSSVLGSETDCEGIGYDADYLGDQPSYDLNEDSTIVTDNVTGLMWTASSDLDGDGESTDVDDKRSYSDAVAYCSDLSLGGYEDWRLPDIKTLYSLIQFSGEDPSGYTGSDTSSLVTFLDPVFSRAFGDQSSGERIIDGQYATSTKYVSTTMNNDETMFGVNFVDGRIKGYPLSMGSEDKLFYVLCTRGEEDYGKNSFVDNNDSTITDNATGLMWQQDDSISTDFEDAVLICENSLSAGYDDWRLPNAKELQSIVDYSRSPDTTNSAAIDPLFNATSISNEEGVSDWGYYWSSTTHATSQGGESGAYLSFGRALGYINGSIIDVHGAGSQRSNAKLSGFNDPAVNSATDANGETYYYKGPQGDILRVDNMVRCVRDANITVSSGVSDGYILFSTMGSNETYLIDNNAAVVKTFTSSYQAASSSYLSDDYTLLRAGIKNEARSGTFSSGGAVGGIIEELDDQSNVIWSYSSVSDDATLHHDFKQIDENTILALAWELRTYNENEYWNEKVLKIDKVSSSVIWEWSAMDDGNMFPSSTSADYIHFNSIDYKEGKIILSSRAQNKLIEIDESTKSIITTYTAGDTLEGQHDATYLENGNILVYNNERDGTSSVLEIDSNDEVVWSYENQFYSNHISGAQRLENGNTLICSGVEGEFIEVNEDKQEVWKYTNTYTNSSNSSNSVFKIRKYLQYQ